MEKKLEIPATLGNLEKAMNFIEDLLTKRRISSKNKTKTILIAEETIARMMENSDENAVLIIEDRGYLGNINLRLKSKGNAFDIEDIESHLMFDGDLDGDDEGNDVIRHLIDKLFWDRLSIRNNKGVNIAQIKVAKSAYSSIIKTLIALAVGLIIGGILHFCTSEDFANASVKYVFGPVFTVLMNALKMMIGPLVFFSIASSIADFSDFRTLGKIAIKVVCIYIVTSMIAVTVGYFTSFLVPQGNPDLVKAVGNQASDLVSTGKATDVSILSMIINIVPLDIVTPFQNSDMLQLIFLAVVIGITGATMGNKCPGISNALTVLNKMCSTIVAYIVKFVPVMVVCCMAKMMISINLRALKDVLICVVFDYVGCFVMIIAYMLLLIIFGRVNPFKFFKKVFPAILMAFSTDSSNAALPTSFERCDMIGVSRKVSSFSLPLGATINMDGFCVILMVTTIFVAGIYGIPIEGGTLTTLLISVVALSVGSPGVPGAGMVCMTILFPQVGIPAEAVALIMGIYPLIGMIMAGTNVAGDNVVTTIVAKHEKMLDMKKFNS